MEPGMKRSQPRFTLRATSAPRGTARVNSASSSAWATSRRRSAVVARRETTALTSAWARAGVRPRSRLAAGPHLVAQAAQRLLDVDDQALGGAVELVEDA